MEDSLITIIAIFIAAILMFIVPMMSMSEMTDDISGVVARIATVDFVDTVRKTGRLTEQDYNKFYNTLATTGNAYDIQLKVQVLDENASKKTTLSDSNIIGENVYYDIYTSQIMENVSKNGVLVLKEGDIFSANVKNTNLTIAQQMQNFFYTIAGNDMYSISGKHAGVVTLNGN